MLDQELVVGIATELAVDPSFVEKDWHAMRLVATVAGINAGGVQPVFAGGTSLSKAFGLIKRFSEDLDFRLMLPDAGIGRPARRQYRELVIETIRANEGWTIKDEDIEPRNESKFFSCLVGYPENFAIAPALRTNIRLEMTFLPPAIPAESRPLQSFVAQAQHKSPEVEEILCIAPVETAAEKLSALTWRVISRQRGEEGDDPRLIRHLHDLAALEALAREHPDFPRLLEQAFRRDDRRGRDSSDTADLSSGERLSAALELLAEDPEYPKEYDSFVGGVSYASEDETPSFEQALGSVRRLGRQFLRSS